MSADMLLRDDKGIADDRTDERLETHRRHRRFTLTPEPRGGAWRDARSSRFAVQLHHASHRHFDLRLQIGTVLRGWAIPRGPSRDPETRRLAIALGDQPLESTDLEDGIPGSRHGGGVAIWDHGFWQADGDPLEALQRGQLGFTLYGKRLSGHWRLQRTSKSSASSAQQWLLIKSRDGSAVDGDVADDRSLKAGAAPPVGPARTPPPDHTALQLATSAGVPPMGRHWLHELKYDGYRLMMLRDGNVIRLLSRNGLDWTSRLPHLVSALRGLRCRDAVLDAELVALDPQGRSDFARLQRAMTPGASAAGTTAIAFDLLLLDGTDRRHLPLTERKRLLARLLADGTTDRGVLRIADSLAGHGNKAYKAACSLKFEGIVSKDRRAPYAAGRRGYWRKVRCTQSDEFVVVGYTVGKDARRDPDALLLARPDRDGGWRYMGRVGSGFSDATQRLLRARLKATPAAPQWTRPEAVPAPDRAQAVWVRPSCVVEVHHRGFTDDGLLRQASYKGMRPDKSVSDLQPSPATLNRHRDRRRSERRDRALPIALTHPQKPVFSSPPLTKADVAHYYMSVAARMLPQIRRRPIALLRCADGISDACFFQRHLSAGFGPQVHETDDAERSIYIDDIDGLIALVQMGTVEIHVAQATIDEPDCPDRMVFDLDPGAGVQWRRVVAAARTLRERLSALRLQSFVRTSGGKGLHVVVPLAPVSPVATVSSFAQAFARSLAAEQPEMFVAAAGESRRRNRIFIDYLRNSRDGWAVASYSLRARAGAPAAVPLQWHELSKVGSSDRHDADSVRRRLARLHRDPWAGFGALRQTLPDGTA